jgi:hypothetical protein
MTSILACMINTAVPMITTPIIDILFTAGSIIFDIIMSLFWQVVAVLGLGGGGFVCGDIISMITSFIPHIGLGTIVNNIIGAISGVI